MRFHVVSGIGFALMLIASAQLVCHASIPANDEQVYENDGKGSFIAHDIDTATGQEAYDLKAVELDADGRLDLILAGRETGNVVWYQNQKPR
jgi:hypothetical protein